MAHSKGAVQLVQASELELDGAGIGLLVGVAWSWADGGIETAGGADDGAGAWLGEGAVWPQALARKLTTTRNAAIRRERTSLNLELAVTSRTVRLDLERGRKAEVLEALGTSRLSACPRSR